jgi:hypothetical protein
MKNMANRADELTMTENKVRLNNARAHRRSRAKWWFARRRQVVDVSSAWPPVGSARPENTMKHGRNTMKTQSRHNQKHNGNTVISSENTMKHNKHDPFLSGGGSRTFFHMPGRRKTAFFSSISR